MTWPPRWMREFPASSLQVHYRLVDPEVRLPEHLELTCRGALGAAMIRVACVREDVDCGSCDRSGWCPVSSWFDPGRLGSPWPRPFALRAAHRTNEGFRLDLALLSPGHAALWSAALTRLGLAGLGPERHPAVMTATQVWTPEGPAELLTAPPSTLGDFAGPDLRGRSVRVLLQSPLRLGGRHKPKASSLLTAIIRRIRALAQREGRTVAHRWPSRAGLNARVRGLEFIETSRFSVRQDQRLDLGGWIGEIEFAPGVADPFLDLLAAAEVVQVGQHTSAGLGVIRVEEAC